MRGEKGDRHRKRDTEKREKDGGRELQRKIEKQRSRGTEKREDGHRKRDAHKREKNREVEVQKQGKAVNGGGISHHGDRMAPKENDRSREDSFWKNG